MAKKSNRDDVFTMAQALSEMHKDSEKVEAQLIKILSTGEQLSRGLEKDFKKIRVQHTKDLKQLQKEYEKAIKTNREYANSLKEQFKERAKSINQIDKLIDSTKEETKEQKKFNISKLLGITQLKKYAKELANSAYQVGILSLALRGLTALYNNWADLQQKTTQAMGRSTQALGNSASEMQSFQRRAEGLRETFSRLEGDVDGIAGSYENLMNTSLALRTNISSLAEGVEGAMLRTARGFGVGHENAAQLFRLLQTGVSESSTNIDEFGSRMINFAESIGANASQMVGDFIEARSAVAQFGQQGEQVFRDAAMMANEFGFETRRIFDMMKGFDTFHQASQNVNQLNAMLGTSLSSFELMMEQNPAQRLEMIRQAVAGVGTETVLNNRYAMQALAQMTGESEDVLRRIFQGRSLDDIRAEQQRAEADQRRREQRHQSAQEVMQNLLMRTSVVWDNMGRIIQRIINDVTQTLSPVFEVIHDEADGIATEFRNWLQTMVQSGQAEQTIHDISNWIRDIFQWFREVNWNDVWQRTQATWREWQPVVQQVGSMILSVLRFASEHPGVVAAALGGALLFRNLGPLMSTVSGLQALMGASAGPGLTALAGLAIPLAAIAGSALVAQQAESRRIEEGRRAAAGDTATRLHLAQSGRDELRRRANNFRVATRLGNSNPDIVNGADSYALRLQEGLGIVSGQEADQRRNNIAYSIDDIIRGRAMPQRQLEGWMHRNIPERMIQQIVRSQNASNLHEYLTGRYAELNPDGLMAGAVPANNVTPTSATESAPVTNNTQNANTNVPTVTRNTTQAQINLHIDRRQIGNAFVEIPQR